MDEVRLRPGGSFPVRDQEPPRPIPNGPPGVPRDGNPSSWKEHDNSWRSPFKGDLALLYPGLQNLHWLMPGSSHPSCQTHTFCKHTHSPATLAFVEVYMVWLMTVCLEDSLSVSNNPPVCCAGSPSGNQPIRSRLVDDSPAVISPPGGPPGLNMRRGPPDGPPGTGEWHPGSEGWRRAGVPPQEWRGPPGPMAEDDEAMSPRRHGSGRPSQVSPNTIIEYTFSHMHHSCVL